MVLSVGVFAYNEEELIEGCLASILAAADESVRVFVLINGCTDSTEQVVRRYAEGRQQIVPVALPVADKANAWNEFIHRIAPESDICFLVDGDMQIVPGSFAAVARCFAEHPAAMAVAGVPSTGRTVLAFREMIVRDRVLAGNFYALRGSTVRKFRELGVRLPFGMVGEDGLVATLVKWNLDPKSQPDPQRIEPCLDAQWRFDSFTPLRPKHWRLYKNRMMRYATRRLQAQMLYHRLWERGISGMPADVMALYREDFARCRISRVGLEMVFDLWAYQRIRRLRAAASRLAMWLITTI
jgi:glycosyltransferase involved in cell wall biosynthesis